MYPGEGKAQIAQRWISRTMEAILDKEKLKVLIEDMDRTLWGLWMGKLRGSDMQFYKWLDDQRDKMQKMYENYKNEGESK